MHVPMPITYAFLICYTIIYLFFTLRKCLQQLRTPNPGFFPTYPVHSRTTNSNHSQRMPQAKTNDL